MSWHRRQKEVLLGWQSINNHTQACGKIFSHAHLVEVQRSHVALNGTTAVRNKEIVENVE